MIVPIASIVVPESRDRKEFEPEALSDLCDDIALNGLQHAPVVRAENGSFVLVSGERRLRAITDLASAGVCIRHGEESIPLDHIPVTNFGALTHRQAKIMELHENIKRKDLAWQERIEAEAQLHQERSEEAAEQGKQQTYIATAEELMGKTLRGSTEQAYAITQVRTSVILAPHLKDPEVAKAANPKEALKIVQKKATEEHYRKVAQQLGSTQTTERHSLLFGKAEELMPGLLQEHFDCLLCDPPYGIGAQNFGTQVSNEHKFDDSYEYWQKLMPKLAHEAMRFCKPQAHAYVFCDPQLFSELRAFFATAGWNVWRTPLIWDKGTGMLPRPDHGPRRCYEAILYAIKGDKTTTGVHGDVLRYSPEKTTIHPDQKPVDLYVDLLRRSVRPGQLVIDTFAGSGTIFVAADKLQLTATGIESEQISYALSTERLNRKETV
jgi:site-specific DNA-methyltransferase (adenine-specific)